MNLKLILTLSMIIKSAILLFLVYVIFDEYRTTDGNLLFMPFGEDKIPAIIFDLFILSLLPPLVLSVKDLKSNPVDSNAAIAISDAVLDYELSNYSNNEQIKNLKKFHPLHFWTLITSIFHVGTSGYALLIALKRNSLIGLSTDSFGIWIVLLLLGLFLSGVLSLVYLYSIKKKDF